MKARSGDEGWDESLLVWNATVGRARAALEQDSEQETGGVEGDKPARRPPKGRPVERNNAPQPRGDAGQS